MLLLAATREELGELDGEPVGIGPVLAAVRAAALIERRRPERVLLIGTGGAYGPAHGIGSAVVGRGIGLSWGVAAMGLGYVPRPPQPLQCDEAWAADLELPRADVLTVGAVTTDAVLAERLSDGWDVEHMEAFAVALACHEAGIPFLAVLGIASRVGPDAHTQWLTNRLAAQDAARDAIRPLLEVP